MKPISLPGQGQRIPRQFIFDDIEADPFLMSCLLLVGEEPFPRSRISTVMEMLKL